MPLLRRGGVLSRRKFPTSRELLSGSVGGHCWCSCDSIAPARAPNHASTLASRLTSPVAVFSLVRQCHQSWNFIFPPPTLQISNIVVMHASSHIVAKRMVIVCGFSQHLGFISSVRRPSVGGKTWGLFFSGVLGGLVVAKKLLPPSSRSF